MTQSLSRTILGLLLLLPVVAGRGALLDYWMGANRYKLMVYGAGGRTQDSKIYVNCGEQFIYSLKGIAARRWNVLQPVPNPISATVVIPEGQTGPYSLGFVEFQNSRTGENMLEEVVLVSCCGTDCGGW
jgi:hypothetical protein